MRVLKWIVPMLSIMLLAGCGYKDIDKRFFAVSIGIDTAKSHSKKYLVSIKFAIPAMGKKSNDFMIVSEEADTIAEAVRIIKTKVDKEVDFSHAKVFIMSPEVARNKMEPHLYYWPSRRRDFQGIAWVALGKPTALDVLKVKPKSEQIPSNWIFMTFGKEGSETPYVIPEFLFDFKKRFAEKGLDPLLPIIEAKKEFIEVNSVGLFNKKRLKMNLPPEETKMLNYLLNMEVKSAIKVHQGKDDFIIDTQNVKTSYKIQSNNHNHPVIDVYLKVSGKIEEEMFQLHNRDLSYYEKLTKKTLDNETKKLLIKMQKANVDPVGFGLNYRAHHLENNDWQSWQRLYPHVTFKVHSHVQIKDTGLIE
ncbi:Ger(x)C family spore germination protein [Bacillota bacterium Lsc_1132]